MKYRNDGGVAKVVVRFVNVHAQHRANTVGSAANKDHLGEVAQTILCTKVGAKSNLAWVV